MIPFLLLMSISVLSPQAPAKDSPTTRRQHSKEFHLRAQERTGLLIPLYLYPANIHTNATYNRLIDLKRRHETVPIWVILNPASGPGMQVDANYTKAIDRFIGSGCIVLGYVSTNYGKRPENEVRKDIDRWHTMYPRAQGIFFDEMIYEDTDAGPKYQASLNRYAAESGYWPTVANPGADTPGRYFAAEAADVIVIHEGDSWPEEKRLAGDYFGGYSDYPPSMRAVLLHSQSTLDLKNIRMARKYVRWIYVTEDLYRPNDPKADNPWDTLSKHLDELCEQLAQP